MCQSIINFNENQKSYQRNGQRSDAVRERYGQLQGEKSTGKCNKHGCDGRMGGMQGYILSILMQTLAGEVDELRALISPNYIVAVRW